MSRFSMTLLASLALACSYIPPPTPDGGAPVGGNVGGGSGGGGPNNVVVGAVAGTESATWTNVTGNLAGKSSACGAPSGLTMHPTKDMVIVGVAPTGLWSTAGGTTWTQLGQAMSSAAIDNGLTMLLFDPEHPDTFWEAGIYGSGGLYRTDDSGVTFTQVGKLRHNDAVGIDFTDPERKTMLMSGHESAEQLYVSTNSGADWTEIGKPLPSMGVKGFVSMLQVIDARTFLFGSYFDNDSGVFRSTDQGATWTQVNAGGVGGKLLIHSDGSYYWLLQSGRGLIRSTDKGVTWTRQLGSDVVEGLWGLSLFELPDGRLGTMGKAGVIVSKDKGVTWRTVGSKLPYEPSGIVYSKFQKAFFINHFQCGTGNQPVPDDAVMRLDFDYQAHP